MDISQVNVTHAMGIPALGMVVGLLVAVFISYRKKRVYDLEKIEQVEQVAVQYNPLTLMVAGRGDCLGVHHPVAGWTR